MFPLPAEYGVEILRSEIGSTLHGTSLGTGQEDHDEMGIYVEYPESTIGLDRGGKGEKKSDDWRFRTAGGQNRSQAGDTDLICYTLRKWARLAVNGNPMALLILFSPDNKLIINTDLAVDLRDNREWFITSKAAAPFIGYMMKQRARLTGERGRAGRVRYRGPCPKCNGQGRAPSGGQAVCNECGGLGILPDWKYAMHLLRLGWQGVEFLETGNINLPIPGLLGMHLRAVRNGEVPILDVLAEAEGLETQLKILEHTSPLPPVANLDAIEEWLVDAHLSTWDVLTSFECGINHDDYCCRSHGTHTMPHKGCLLR